MKVLLGSGGIRTEERRILYRNLMSEHFDGCKRVVFVPFASQDHEGYTTRMQEFTEDLGYELIGLHEFEDSLSAIEAMDGIYVGGGNTWLLVKELHKQGLIEPIREAVLERGVPYAGVSAGANVASPSMQTTNDMAITMVPSFDTFGIIPFQINPHYHPGGIWYRESEEGEVIQHFGETRARRISEFHQINDTPVIGLYEGAFLRYRDNNYELIGNKAAVIRKGEEAITYDPGTFLREDLTTA
ncbi:MAG: dipeptidase PepE [Candidatus Thalassarchaeaceae archaeon]|nr:dipeptidase PepE [Candidatus Thalassarchaeaceae archaeon]